MEKKESKTGAIIATVASALVCGCAGLVACVFGILALGQFPVTTTVNGYSTVQPLPMGFGFLICLAVILVAVPVVVGVLTLRKKKPKEGVAEVLPPSEPLPPAS
jgi:hypothetical protein